MIRNQGIGLNSYIGVMLESDKQQLQEILSNWLNISNASFQQFASICEIQTLKKGSYFAQKSKPIFNEALILSGVIRGYHLTPDGNEINTVFYDDNAVIAPLFSRSIKRSFSSITLQALTDVRLMVFSAEKFYELMTQNEEVKNFGQAVVESELKYRMEREIMGISLDAKSRLEKFREIHPGLENKISQIQVAQFLGITPVSLSRLRGK